MSHMRSKLACQYHRRLHFAFSDSSSSNRVKLCDAIAKREHLGAWEKCTIFLKPCVIKLLASFYLLQKSVRFLNFDFGSPLITFQAVFRKLRFSKI